MKYRAGYGVGFWWLVTMVSAEPGIAGTCSGPSTLEGIDVSHYDGDVDWEAVAATKSFAFARVSDGTSVDPTFAQNYAGIRAAGMVRSGYQTFEPAEDPVAQANLVLQEISVPLQPGDLPPALDVEITGGQSPATLASNIQTWITTIQNAIGKPPIIYVSAAFWNTDVQSMNFSDIPLWVGNWNVSCPTLPTGWTSWLFWQHSDSGSVAGVSDMVDLDTFNGSAQDLAALVQNDRVFSDGFESL